MEKYEPLGVVGEGSYGVVLKCRCRENGRIVAIKKFIDSEDDQNVRKIALREIRVLRKLRHENLVNLIEVFRRRKHIYLVFEFIDHTLLDQLEQKTHGLDEETCRKYIFQILRGLGFCHDNNVIHRDVKPENVLVSKSGIVKLCDFGFARNLCGPGDAYTDYVATRWYRAPELLVGDVAYGKEVDIWAVGCLFAEMMTGEPLFPGDSDIDQLFLIAQCLGRLAKRHLSIMARNSAFRGFQYPKSRHGSSTSTGSSKFKFPEQQSRNRSGSKVSVFSVMFPSWPDEAVFLLTLCLDPEPSSRPTCSALLRLPYFTRDNFPTKYTIVTGVSGDNPEEIIPPTNNSFISGSGGVETLQNVCKYFARRFLTELNQKLQQEGRDPIKAFSKKQQQRIANVSPSVPMVPMKHIQSSHPILRNTSMDDVPPLKSLQSQTTSTTSTSSLSMNRQQTFIVEKPVTSNKISSNNSKPLALEPKFQRKPSADFLLLTGTPSSSTATPSTTLPSTASFSLPEALQVNNFHTQIPHQQQQQTPFQTQHPLQHQHHLPHHHETRRFSMSRKYSEQAEDESRADGLSMHLNLNNNRQLPVTTLTFSGSNMFMTSNAPAPIRSPNNINTSVGQKKASPKKSIFYSQSSSKPVAFGSSIHNKESFLPRMKVVEDNNSTLPFLTLGSPTKPGASSVRKRDKWEPGSG